LLLFLLVLGSSSSSIDPVYETLSLKKAAVTTYSFVIDEPKSPLSFCYLGRFTSVGELKLCYSLILDGFSANSI